MKTIIQSFFSALIFLSCFTTTSLAQEKQIFTSKKIWDEAPHNAFTDLIKFDGKYYCTFREGDGHIPNPDNTGNGKARLLVSADGDTWETAKLFEKEGVDLRDPKLSITPDGRLMVLIGGAIYVDGKGTGNMQLVSFADKATKSFTELQKVAIDPSIEHINNWLWRVTWSQSTGYGVVYRFLPDEDWQIYLVKTTDGINYRLITKLEVNGRPNEATVEVLDNDRMRILVRREEANNSGGYLGYSEKEFTDWKWTDIGIRLGGPNIITLPNGKTIIGSRTTRDRQRLTALFGLDENGKAVELLALPSGMDTSYTGFVVEKDELWVSYYSGHEGKTSIYLAKIKYNDLQK